MKRILSASQHRRNSTAQDSLVFRSTRTLIAEAAPRVRAVVTAPALTHHMWVSQADFDRIIAGAALLVKA